MIIFILITISVTSVENKRNETKSYHNEEFHYHYDRHQIIVKDIDYHDYHSIKNHFCFV